MVQETNAVLVGVQGTVVPIGPGQFINDALATALAALPPQGGDLYVLPGTLPYGFSSSVIVTKPNVTLHFSRGAILGFGASIQPLVRVRAERFRCVGARVEQVVTAVHSGATCFLIESVGGAMSDEASFVECHFQVRQAAPDIVGFSCIRAMGPAAPAPPRRGLCISECTFIVVSPGVQQTNAFTGGDPHGVCMVRTSDCLETILVGNYFRGSAVTGDVHCGPILFARGAASTIVNDCIFRDVRATPQSGEQALIDIGCIPGADDLGVVLARNVFETARADAVVRIEGGRGLCMSSFNIGRVGNGARAALQLAPSVAGGAVTAASVHGGNFHNVERLDGYMVQAEVVRDMTISGNAFSILGATQEFLSFAPGQCTGVVIAPRQPQERKL